MTFTKIIGRILVFLLAAAIVLAGVNVLNSAGVLSSMPGGPEGGLLERGFQPNSATQDSTDATGTALTPPSFNRGGGEHETEGFSLAGLATVGKNFIQMSLIVAVVALITRAAKLLGKRRAATVSA